MNLSEEIKIKYMTANEITIAVDRLTRFKNPAEKYLRVFKDVITGHLLSPSVKKSDIENLEPNILKSYVEMIINKSIERLGLKSENDFEINKKIYIYENSIFKISDDINFLIDNKIQYKSILNLLNNDLSFNLKWLKTLTFDKNSIELREKYSLVYPIEKLVLAEGITEEILLPKFARILGCDFGKKGIYVISAGGKNQVVKYFYKFAEILKIPIFVLLDKDAEINKEQIIPKLRDNDYIHILNSGEFEDTFSNNIIEKALINLLENISIIDSDILKKDLPMTKRLEEIFRTRGLHDFKKSEFAQCIKQLPIGKDELSDEIRTVVSEIISQKKSPCGE